MHMSSSKGAMRARPASRSTHVRVLAVAEPVQKVAASAPAPRPKVCCTPLLPQICHLVGPAGHKCTANPKQHVMLSLADCRREFRRARPWCCRRWGSACCAIAMRAAGGMPTAHHSLALQSTLQNLPARPRRNRRSETFRSAMRESFLSPANFILPIFVHEESDKNQPIASMPDYYRLAYGKNVIDNVAEARSYGINQVVIFPKVRAR